MMQAVKDYLRECGQLLIWAFFQPSAMRIRLKEIAPDLATKEYFFYWIRTSLHNKLLRRLIIQVLLTTITAPFVIHLLIGLGTISFGIRFDWSKSSQAVAGCILIGLVINLRYTIIIGITFGVTFGLATSIWLGIGVSHAISIASGIIGGMVVGADVGILLGLLIGFTYDLPVGLAICVGVLRIPLYIFELALVTVTYRRSTRGDLPKADLLGSPIYFDELMVLPQPYLSTLLLCTAKNNLEEGLRYLSKVVANPFQRWATGRVIQALTKKEQTPFFLVLDSLLRKPTPYVPTEIIPSLNELARAKDNYFTTKLILAELINDWPLSSHSLPKYWLIDNFARRMTFWLQKMNMAPQSTVADLYLQLLQLIVWFKKYASSDLADNSVRLTENGSWLFLFLEEMRGLVHGEEVYHCIRIIELALKCEEYSDIAKLRSEFVLLFKIDKPLRKEIVSVFYKLRDVAVDAASFLTAAHDITRRDALLKAQGALEEARQLADDVYEPERSLLLAVIEHWRRMFAVEGGRVAEKAEVKTLPNPYVAGRPMRPEDGQLFAGRRDEMKQIEEKLQTGVGIVIWGQRRIGKTSILLHLRERLPHDLLPVYLNLQMLMANTTGGFLRALGNEIVKELRDKLHVRSSAFRRQDANGEVQPPEGGTTNTLAEALLSAEEFDREPFLSFNHLLDEVEQRLQPGQRVLLSFDEFEVLEQRVKTGKIEKEIFAYLRGVTQTGRGFALMFAGLHTLEEMTREYWNPFFQSVQTIRIGYLSELDAEQLIRDPMEQFPLDYELEAVNRITEVTRSHPYLTQSLCRNLINRLNDPLYRSQKAMQEDVDAVLERTLESSGYYFDDYVWGWSGADEQLALSLLAEEGDDAAFSVVEKHLGREAALEATRRLVAREILMERTEAGELVFRFQIPLARMWVRRMKSSARILLERSSRA